jgi:hypothetical protein
VSVKGCWIRTPTQARRFEWNRIKLGEKSQGHYDGECRKRNAEKGLTFALFFHTLSLRARSEIAEKEKGSLYDRHKSGPAAKAIHGLRTN